MFGLPSVTVVKDADSVHESVQQAVSLGGNGPLFAPLITHTAATPMATPQGSPNELNMMSGTNNPLIVPRGSVSGCRNDMFLGVDLVSTCTETFTLL
jgi:hypothetical protein